MTRPPVSTWRRMGPFLRLLEPSPGRSTARGPALSLADPRGCDKGYRLERKEVHACGVLPALARRRRLGLISGTLGTPSRTMSEHLHGYELPEGWLDLDAEDTAELATRVGIDLATVGGGDLTARQIRMLMLAEMTAEFAAEDERNRQIAVSKRWVAFRGDELEVIEHALGSYDATDPLLVEVLAEIERRGES